jgi:hypothetical protein
VEKKLGVVVCNCHSSYSRKYKTGELQSRSYSEDLSSKYEQKGPRGMAQAVKHLACKGETQVLPRLRESESKRQRERETLKNYLKPLLGPEIKLITSFFP